jgi:hypothetical protein
LGNTTGFRGADGWPERGIAIANDGATRWIVSSPQNRFFGNGIELAINADFVMTAYHPEVGDMAISNRAAVAFGSGLPE